MEKTQTTLESPVTAGSLTLIPVTRTSAAAWHNTDRSYFSGMKKPLYILVLAPDSGTKAYRITGEQVSPETIMAEFPELRESMKKYYL
ncbi:MAG: hypothetical protein JXA46_01480 [Dehalococcoidales bacterium]|nr:hypothetical protein [Dehalococcoidales bacterium]